MDQYVHVETIMRVRNDYIYYILYYYYIIINYNYINIIIMDRYVHVETNMRDWNDYIYYGPIRICALFLKIYFMK